MADYGLFKNSEGYADPTAYEAILGMAKPGEIWTYRDKEVLVIRNQGSYSNVLQLGRYKDGCIDIAGRYALPGMLSYVFNTLLIECVEKLTEEELNEVLRDVADAMGMQFDVEPVAVNFDAEKVALAAKADTLRSMYSELVDKIAARLVFSE